MDPTYIQTELILQEDNNSVSLATPLMDLLNPHASGFTEAEVPTSTATKSDHETNH